MRKQDAGNKRRDGFCGGIHRMQNHQRQASILHHLDIQFAALAPCISSGQNREGWSLNWPTFHQTKLTLMCLAPKSRKLGQLPFITGARNRAEKVSPESKSGKTQSMWPRGIFSSSPASFGLLRFIPHALSIQYRTQSNQMLTTLPAALHRSRKQNEDKM